MAVKPKATKDKIAASASSGGKKSKKKWSKGKNRDQLNNAVFFDKPTYDKFLKEVVGYKLITPSVVSERLKIRGSLARAALKELAEKNLIIKVCHHHQQEIYTKVLKEGEEKVEEVKVEVAKAKKVKVSKKAKREAGEDAAEEEVAAE